MRKVYVFCILPILFFVYSCQASIEVVHTEVQPTIVLEESQSVEIDEGTKTLILHNSEEELFNIPFISVQILQDYFTSSMDKKIEIERTSSEFLEYRSIVGEKFVVIKYNCGINLCDSILIKVSEDKKTFTSIKLGYGMLLDIKESPNSEILVFRYGVNEGNVVIRHNLIPVNLEEMVVLYPSDNVSTNEFIETATLPITKYHWISDHVLSIQTADIRDTDYASLLKWYNSSRKTKDVEIELLMGSN